MDNPGGRSRISKADKIICFLDCREKVLIGAGAPWDSWEIGAKAACTNLSRNDTVRL